MHSLFATRAPCSSDFEENNSTDCSSQSMISLNVNKLVTYLLFKMIIPKTKLATKEPYKRQTKMQFYVVM